MNKEPKTMGLCFLCYRLFLEKYLKEYFIDLLK